MNFIGQSKFPIGIHQWNPQPPDFSNFEAPMYPLKENIRVAILGTVKNEIEAFQRSWRIWSQQTCPKFLKPEFWVLDDGSSDEIGVWLKGQMDSRIRYAKYREDGGPDRSCTLVFNHAIRHLIEADYILIQWWDRIPGSFSHLALLAEPHLTKTGLITNAVSRHIGGSSSLEVMTPERLRGLFGEIPEWESDPQLLARIAGTIGDHCIPGKASESSGMFLRREDFLSVGGYDERYTQRASYVNVELWRRLLAAGFEALFLPEPHGANYHQSHFAERSSKTMEYLADRRVKRNQEIEWGSLEPLEVW